jgi:hypothetical protein
MVRDTDRASCIHTPRDGRGARKVYLNGVEVQKCVYANTRAGKVRVIVHRNGMLVFGKHGKSLRTKTLYGRVEVVEAKS